VVARAAPGAPALRLPPLGFDHFRPSARAARRTGG